MDKNQTIEAMARAMHQSFIDAGEISSRPWGDITFQARREYMEKARMFFFMLEAYEAAKPSGPAQGVPVSKPLADAFPDERKVRANRPLSDERVRSIKIRLRNGEGTTAIARSEKLSENRVYSIKQGRVYRDVKIGPEAA